MKSNELAISDFKKYGIEGARKEITNTGAIMDRLELEHLEYIEYLKRLVESHENIELLGGLVKSKEILKSAPDGADSFVHWTGKIRYLNSNTKCIFSEKSNEWLPANIMVLNLKISFVALKEAIVDVESCQ